jgi:hypothetical protein
MLKIKLPFGFKTLQLDNLFVFYTGKIRVKADADIIANALAHVEGLSIVNSKNYCTIISYVVTDHSLHVNMMTEINKMLAKIMHDRIDQKYAYATGYQVETVDITDELCW